MKNLEQLQKEVQESRKLLAELTKLAEVEQHIAEGNLALYVGHSMVLDSKEGLQHIAVAYVNKKKAELRELGADAGPDLFYPGVTYTGASVDFFATKARFPADALPGFRGAMSVISANNGSWQMDENGTLTVSSGEDSAPFAVVDGKTYLKRAEFDNAYPLRTADIVTEMVVRADQVDNLSARVARADEIAAVAARVLHLEASVESLRNGPSAIRKVHLSEKDMTFAAGIQLGDLSKEEKEIQWNKPEDLPPVGCDLLIKVPQGTRVLNVKTDRASMGYDTESELVFKVFRTGHLANRDGEMEYRLPDNSTVVGRFPWTYP